MVSRRKLILKSLERINDLPTISNVYNEIIQAIDSDADIEKIAVLAKLDIALSAKVLKIVNSPVYQSLGKEVTDVETGVVRLGTVEFKKIVISLSVIETFGSFSNKLDYQHFWQHCLTTAFITLEAFAKISAKKLGKKVSGELYSAALLHDIGILILDHYFPDYYEKVLLAARSPNAPKIIELEQEMLEITHEEVGEIIALRWQLPEHLRAAIRYHHNIKDYTGKYEPIVRVVKIANEICTLQGIGSINNNRDDHQDKRHEEIKNKLVEKSDLYQDILSNFQADVDRSQAIMRIL
ncbi:MAG: hypothetical protein A2284_08965 [Deltaproteobacteria bacterium RIFOXYA12_FULL_61_11]|nr:MAG: hypothetical protein A2284_08965 [Deltaproteobacteria bacterium RIFOXYA12_FULL_61_11]